MLENENTSDNLVFTCNDRTASKSFRFSSSNVVISSWARFKHVFNTSLSCFNFPLKKITRKSFLFSLIIGYYTFRADTYALTSLDFSAFTNSFFKLSLSIFNLCITNCTAINSRSRSFRLAVRSST